MLNVRAHQFEMEPGLVKGCFAKQKLMKEVFVKKKKHLMSRLLAVLC